MLSLLVASAFAGDACETIGMADIVAVPPPAVIVLGERHGTQPDLGRAARVMRRLARTAPVTLALEAVHEDRQRTLDDFADGQVDPLSLESALDWEDGWGFPYRPYEPLVTAAIHGVEVIAAGPDLEPAPEGRRFPVPTGYAPILADAMADHAMPKGMEERFVRSMAWRDHRIADRAAQAWDGRGYLVVVTGRGHVEGGRGVPWQLGRMVEQPVHAFVLAWADPPCYAGDRVWRPSIWERLFSRDTPLVPSGAPQTASAQ